MRSSALPNFWWIVSRIIFPDYTSDYWVSFSSPDCNLVIAGNFFLNTSSTPYNICCVYVLLTASQPIMYRGLQSTEVSANSFQKPIRLPILIKCCFLGMVTEGPQVRRLSLVNGQQCLIMIVISISWSLSCWWF